ncbi:MAG: Spy/CpxP family protein refolding chaperone [Chitinophagales bacterium]
MKKPSIKILSVAVILLLIVNTVLLILLWKGKEKQEPRRQGNGGPFETMVHELNMTEQQKNDYQKLRDEYFASVRPLFDSIREVRKNFTHFIQEPAVSDSTLSAYSKQIAEKQALIDKLTFTHFRTVRALFSGDQQKKFDDFMQKMMQQRNGPRRRDSANKK